MATKKLKPGDVYDGPKAVVTDEAGVTAHYALDDDGTPTIRLVQVDLAPDDPDDGSEEYRIAGDDDPVYISAGGSLVELEAETQGHASTEV